MSYFYKLFGFKVRSDWKFAPAFESEEQLETEVSIEACDMPEWIEKKKKEGHTQSTDQSTYFWFLFENEGEFLIQNGNQITYHIFENHLADHVDAILLGECFSYLFFQRGEVSLHAGGVAWEKSAILLSGLSGCGKSTISSALVKRGGIFMADDTVRLVFEEGTALACSGYPQQKLCTDAAQKQGFCVEKLHELKEEQIKYAIPAEPGNYHESALKAGILVILQKVQAEHLIFQEINGSTKLKALISCLYNYKLYEKYGMNADVLKKCIQIANQLKIVLVQRPENQNTEKEIVDYIVEIMEG